MYEWYKLYCGILIVKSFKFQSESSDVTDAVKAKILDLYITKYWGIRFATDAANTVLNVDQVNIQINLQN